VSEKQKGWRKRYGKNVFVRFLTSLRLTVTLLAFSMALVFFGTIDQVNIGIPKALDKYFESFLAVWKYPKEWPMGTRMIIVTHPESDLADNHETISIEDDDLRNIRFLGFLDNTFHDQIKAVFADSDGKLEPDDDLRFHTLREIKTTLAKEEYKNGYAAILPDTIFDPPDEGEEVGNLEDLEDEPDLAVIEIGGQFPFTLRWIRIPLPGGYLLGGLLFVNLMCSALFRYPLKPRHTGIWAVHGGLALMLVSELVTDLTEKHSSMSIHPEQSSNFSYDFLDDELVIVKESASGEDEAVLSIPADQLDPTPDDVGSRIGRFFSGAEEDMPVINLKEVDKDFPFIVKVKKFYKNSAYRSPHKGETHYTVRNSLSKVVPIVPIERNETFKEDDRNHRAALVELSSEDSPDKPIGEWFLCALRNGQVYHQAYHFDHGNESFRIELRRKRHYYPFRVKLLDFRHLRYAGTSSPKDFSSDVSLQIPGEPDRKARIYMNHPLHVRDLVFYQRSFAEPSPKQVQDYSMELGNDVREGKMTPEQAKHKLDLYRKGMTVLEVVRNPGSSLPYIGVSLVGLGLAFQFGFHLFGFARRRAKTKERLEV